MRENSRDRAAGRVEAIAWTEEAPRKNGPYVPIIAAKPGAAVSAIVLSERMTAVYVHWSEGRSTPCRRPNGVCELCELSYATRWKGYLGVFWAESGRIGLIELTTNAVDKCLDLRRKTSLRGGKIKVRRPGSRPNASVFAEFYEYHPSFGFALKDLPPEFDVKGALMKVWFG